MAPIQEGDRFDRLTVFELLGYRRTSQNRNMRMWRCLCDCGASVVVYDQHLKKGNTKSCGCLKLEKFAETRQRSITHGMTNTRTFSSWMSMLKRCNSPGQRAYPYYGGRGVTVCDRWDPAKGGSFLNFLADMGERPEGKSLDKDIRGDGMSYSPDNCCWATPQEQARHRRNTAFGLVGGALLRADQVAEIAGISQVLAYARIRKGFSNAQLMAPHSPNGIAARKSTVNRQLELV